MAEEDVRFAREIALRNLHQLAAVADKGLPAVGFAEIAELVVVLDALAVADMVIDIDGKAVFAKDVRERLIAFLMLRHAVRDLDHRFDRRGILR